MDIKSIPLEIVDMKAVDGTRTFTAYASTFGNTDQGGDIVSKGAFVKSLRSREFRPLLWQHDQRQPIGVERSIREDGKGLLGTWSLLSSGPAEYAYEALKAGAVRAMSIGYVPEVVELHQDDPGVRVLKEVDLLENSVVSLPMNEQALIQDIKGLSELLSIDYDRLATAIAAKLDDKASWDTAYVNKLPDSAFALVYTDDSGTKQRKLPHHDDAGKVDAPHLQNALSRAQQMTGVSDAQKAKAVAHLQGHSKGNTNTKDDEDVQDHDHGDVVYDDLPFAELVSVIGQVHQAFSESARSLLATLASNHATINDSKRQELETLLGTFSGLDAVRTDAQRLLATASEVTKERESTLGGGSGVALRLEMTRRRLRMAGVEV